ncbi:MAG: hypothetical protein KC910_36285 [Candidatus Eremiobacteraeota bacterium]|nr:hypothetical protein [Candidatus Eremiobacteraeota bacterium]
MKMIEFIDGNTNEVVDRRPFDEVPPASREIYLREGVQVQDKDESDEVVPIAKVVKLALDAAGNPAPINEAVKVLIREYDEAGVMRRETLMVRH